MKVCKRKWRWHLSERRGKCPSDRLTESWCCLSGFSQDVARETTAEVSCSLSSPLLIELCWPPQTRSVYLWLHECIFLLSLFNSSQCYTVSRVLVVDSLIHRNQSNLGLKIVHREEHYATSLSWVLSAVTRLSYGQPIAKSFNLRDYKTFRDWISDTFRRYSTIPSRRTLNRHCVCRGSKECVVLVWQIWTLALLFKVVGNGFAE